jgi:Tol biopolymer transport system component
MGEWLGTAVRRTARTVLVAGGTLIGIGCSGDPVTGPTTGSQIVFNRFTRNDDSGIQDIYLMNADGTGQKKVASDGYYAAGSPAGDRIAFLNGDDIYLVNPDGTNRRRVTSKMWDRLLQIQWSPDGSRIAFQTSSSTGESADIWVVGADGSGQTHLLSHATNPVWSPDGHQIAFNSYRDPGRSGINILDLAGGGLTLFAADATGTPAWSPDGGRIAFSSGTETTSQIEIMNRDGTGRATLMSGTGGISPYVAWSPDGQMIAFVTDRSGSWDIWTMRADGSAQTNLTNHEAFEDAPIWSPDGRQIAFTRWLFSAIGGVIYVVNADGTGLSNVSHTPDGSSDDGPSWRPVD